MAEVLFCWSHWLGKHNSDIWNLIPGCLMWTIWTEWNGCSFEDSDKSLVELKGLCQHSLFDWSQFWEFTDCSSLLQFFSSLSLVSWLFFFLFSVLCFAVVVHPHEHIVCFFFMISSIIVLILPIKKNFDHLKNKMLPKCINKWQYLYECILYCHLSKKKMFWILSLFL